MNKATRAFGCVALGALAMSSLPEAASAGPTSLVSKSAIFTASPAAQVEDVRYVRRYAARRHYRSNPGAAVAGAALGLMGAAALGAMSGGYGYYGYPGYYYGYPYGYYAPYSW